MILTAWTIASYFVQSDGLAISSLALVFACWSIAGYVSARRTVSTSSGWVAGCWSGVVCVLINVTCSLLILRLSPPSGNFVHVLTAGGQHLLEGPVIGAALGAIAGLAARIRGTIVLHRIGLAGGK